MLATFPVSKELFSNLSFVVDTWWKGRESETNDKKYINLLDSGFAFFPLREIIFICDISFTASSLSFVDAGNYKLQDELFSVVRHYLLAVLINKCA